MFAPDGPPRRYVQVFTMLWAIPDGNNTADIARAYEYIAAHTNSMLAPVGLLMLAVRSRSLFNSLPPSFPV